MAKNEWESGSIVIPAKEWPGFKRKLRDEHDRLQRLRLELATSLSTELKTLGRGKRNFDFEEAAEDLFQKRAVARFSPLAEESFFILKSIFPTQQGAEKPLRVKPLTPKKKDFPLATSKTFAFDCDEASITLDDKERKFRWHVSENNHAVERAHEHPLAVAAFKALDRIQWTRGTGGKITGNDEYNQESRDDGGGANYATYRYGPLGKDVELEYLLKKSKRRAPRR
jgi:hypothetical protein